MVSYRHRTDFLMTGVALLPVLLACAGALELAILVLVPLLIAACLCGQMEQVECGAAASPAAETDTPLGRPAPGEGYLSRTD